MEVPQERTVIAGRYELQSLIGEGGMGSVWRARDTTLARLVAVKLLFARDDRDRNVLVERFLREARIAAAVQHRNVIHIVDFGTTEAGQPFMVMELLKGEPLSDRLVRPPPLDAATFINIASMTLRGLGAVHEAGIIHRDLKPDNIYLTQQDQGVFPKILDFGISRSVEPASGRRSALTTKEGLIVGTPEYMSPEQARGIRNIDHRSDLYSMGVILYEGLTGTLPHASENVGDLIIQIVTATADRVDVMNPAIPSAIADVVERAMAHAPADRFQSAQEMQDALMRAAANNVLSGVTRPLSERPMERSERLHAPTLDGHLEFDIDAEAASDPVPGAAHSYAHSQAGVRPQSPLPPLPPPPPAAGSATSVTSTSSIPPTPAGGRGAGLWLGLGLATVAAIAMGLLTREGAQTEDARPLAAVAPEPAITGTAEPEAPEPTPTEAPPPKESTVTLAGLPEGALVSVDGTQATALPLTFARDGSEHTIAVSKPGMQPWQARYRAEEDVTLAVELAPMRAPRTSKSTGTKKASDTGTPRARRTGAPKSKKPPRALRQLDF